MLRENGIKLMINHKSNSIRKHSKIVLQVVVDILSIQIAYMFVLLSIEELSHSIRSLVFSGHHLSTFGGER